MSDWYQDQQNEKTESIDPKPTAEEPTAPAPEQEPPVQQPAAQYTPPSYTGYNQSSYSNPYTAYNSQRPSYQAPVTPPSKKSRNLPVIILAVLCAVSILTTVGVTAMFFNTRGDITTTQDVTQSTAPKGEPNENAPTLEISDSAEYDDGGLSTSAILAKNLDSTVMLTMYQKSSWSGGYYGYDTSSTDGLTQVGSATGIIYSEDGYIITNSHCVYDEDNAVEYDRIVVTLYNGSEYDAAIIGYDPTTDLAVIKVDAAGLSAAEFGDSSSMNLGDRVVTLGNSGGLAWSASQGILSGQARDVYEDTGYAIKCLQVDAVINPGSSGGPLLNANGQVVGVNSAKIVMTGYEGLGFSIPINEAKAVIDDLARYGYVRNRVSLGIMGRSITSIGYEGFMIEGINENSALMNTKAAVGDIITHVNGVRVTSYAEMRTELTSYNVGDEVTLKLLRLDRQSRDVEEFDITVTLQEASR